ncbi:MAG: hypothetical protein GXP45_05345 [bacterium]|nr:hypothetical protein [bacterium]
MENSLNSLSKAPQSKLNQLKSTIAETMESLMHILNRNIESFGEFGIKIAEKIKNLGLKFKNYLLADKEIILHNTLRTMLSELNQSLDKKNNEFSQEGRKIYSILQEVHDRIESRLVADPSYQKEFAFLYREDIKPQFNSIESKLTLGS